MPRRFDCSVITSAILGDALDAAGVELGEAVLLDLALGVQAERLLDLDLDPEALAVEAVLVALILAEQGLVALEDVLQRPAPGMVDGHRVVRGHRPVDEGEPRAAGVQLPEPVERPLGLPPFEDDTFQGRMIREQPEAARRFVPCFSV